jgi:acyl-CoA synthetase (AMP-forming)/AMP-acid ligase II
MAGALHQLLAPYLDRLPDLLPHGRIGLDFVPEGWLPFEELRAHPTSAPLPDMAPETPVNLIYSSGTTGSPKGIVHSHRMRLVQVERMARYGLGPEACTLLATPLYSNTTLIALLPTLARGGMAVLQPSFDITQYLRLAERHAATHTILVPVQYSRLLADPGFERYDLSSFQTTWCTGAPLPIALKEELVRRWPGTLVEIYGQTEGGCTTILDTAAHPDKLSTVGQPAPGVEVRILDEDDQVLPGDAVGEIVGRAPSMMSGYHDRPDLTEQLIWRDEEERPFLRTGDLGWLDGDGFLHLAGRKKDVIISSGFNVYPADLEGILAAHPDVAEVAVIGIPSSDRGEAPLGLVVLRPGATVTPPDLCAWVNSRLGRTQRLARIELRMALPRSPQGKLLKEQLCAPFWETR